MKLPFPCEKLLMMHDTATGRVKLVFDHRMTHFVVKHVFQKPRRHESAIEERMDSNKPVLFLDCAKDNAIAWTLFRRRPQTTV
jgi:hypothetical protein